MLSRSTTRSVLFRLDCNIYFTKTNVNGAKEIIFIYNHNMIAMEIEYELQLLKINKNQ